MNKVAVTVVLASVVGLSACSNNPFYGDEGIVRDKKQDYEAATTVPRIKVPDHLDSSSIQDLLVVPEVGTVAIKQEGDFEVPRPSFFYAEAGNDVVNMARDGKEKYILVNEKPEDVWQKMTEFWSFNHLKLAVIDPQQGVMETSWIRDEPEESGFFTGLVKSVTFQGDDENRLDKLRVKLARDDDPNRTAIRMQHIRVTAEEEPAAADWSKEETDVSYKSDMMYALLHYLSKATDSTTAVALKKRETQTELVTQLGRDADSNPVLKVVGDVDDVWASIGDAMDEAQMDVGSSNKEIGKYYLTYTTTTRFNEDDVGGFWGFIKWLHSDRDEITVNTDFLSRAIGVETEEDKIRYSANENTAEDPNSLENKDGYKIWLGGRVVYVFESGENASLNEETGELEHTGLYQVKLSRRSNGVYVSVLTDEAAPANSIVAEEILWVIKENIRS